MAYYSEKGIPIMQPHCPPKAHGGCFGLAVALVATAVSLSGCADPSAATPSQALTLASGFDYSVTGSPGALKLACPQGVRCDARFDYHALAYEDAHLRVNLFFDAQLAEGYSLEAFRKYFQYAKIQFEPEPASTPGTRVLGEATADRSEVTFLSYEDRRLAMQIQGPAFLRVVERRSPDPDCRTGDIAGQCSDMHRVDAPYAITIHAETPWISPD